MILSRKLSIMTGVALAFTVALTSSIILSIMHQELSRQAVQTQETRLNTFKELAAQKGSGFRVADGKLLIGDYVVNDNPELPDKVKALCGGAATIFMGDTRVSTSILKPDGTRAVGTTLVGPAHDAVLNQGVRYVGEAEILGMPYFTVYDPIKTPQGETIGVLFVGIAKSDYFAVFNRIAWLIAFGALVYALGGAIVSAMVIRGQLRGLAEVEGVIVAGAGGNLTAISDATREQTRTGQEAAEQVEKGAAEAFRNAGASMALSATASGIENAVASLEGIAESLVKAVGLFRA